MANNILVIEDDPVLNHVLSDSLSRMGFQTHSALRLGEAHRFLSSYEPSLVIVDARLPDGEGVEFIKNLPDTCAAILLTAYGTVKDAVDAMKAGAAEYLLKPIDLEELEMVVKRTLENLAMRKDYQFCKTQLNNRDQKNKMLIGKSDPLSQVRKLIYAVAPTDMSVLIQGESGTGKEMIASELHRQSHRVQHNFVAIDCCTLQEKLFESELFGHERGAFTGADRQKKGLIEGAEAGTVFLDEIGEISPAIQAKLLRVLETGQYRRLGGTKDLIANVRIVAATNRDLEQMGKEGTFRRDLYYRLSAFVITLPPLRERRDDIPDLARHFIEHHRFSKRINKHFTDQAARALISYDWPGNIRELKNVVERAIILSGELPDIRPEHLSFCRGSKEDNNLGVKLSYDHEPTLEEIEGSYLKVLLQKYSGHRATIAKKLGVSERNTYRLLKKHALV